MSKESAVEDIHRAVESAIESGLSVKDFIREASVSWSQVLLELDILPDRLVDRGESEVSQLLDVFSGDNEWRIQAREDSEAQ